MKEYKAKLPELEIKYIPGHVAKVKIMSSRDIYDYSKLLLNLDTIEYTEEFLVVYLNRANNTIGWRRISAGGISGTLVDIRVILAVALKTGASSLICVHNHPSGNRYPSKADKDITLKLQQACQVMDLNLLDHIIVAGNLEGYYSFADEGIL